MNVFVTGGTGFVGSHLVDQLLARGDDVTCLVRDPDKLHRLFPSQAPRAVVGTLHDREVIERGVTGADVVFHVAGLVAARGRAEFRSINADATRALTAITAKAAPTLQRLVYVSSLAACGPNRIGEPRTAQQPATPVSDYGWSKLAGEEAVRRSGLPWTIVRPPTVYGPRDTELFKLFKLAKLGVTPVFGSGTQENSFVFGPDLTAGLIACLVPAAVGQTYFACHPEIRTQRELAVAVYRALRDDASSSPIVVPIPAVAARAALWMTGTAARLVRVATIMSPDKAAEFLAPAWTCEPGPMVRDTGWTAGTDLRRGLAATATWYREAGWL